MFLGPEGEGGVVRHEIAPDFSLLFIIGIGSLERHSERALGGARVLEGHSGPVLRAVRGSSASFPRTRSELAPLTPSSSQLRLF